MENKRARVGTTFTTATEQRLCCPAAKPHAGQLYSCSLTRWNFAGARLGTHPSGGSGHCSGLAHPVCQRELTEAWQRGGSESLLPHAKAGANPDSETAPTQKSINRPYWSSLEEWRAPRPQPPYSPPPAHGAGLHEQGSLQQLAYALER